MLKNHQLYLWGELCVSISFDNGDIHVIIAFCYFKTCMILYLAFHFPLLNKKYERKAFLKNHVFSIVKMPSKGDGIVIPMMVL